MVGTPATQMQSFTAIRFPTSGPLAAPAISVTRAKAPKGLSAMAGMNPGKRG